MNIRDLPQPHSNMKIPSPGRFHQACLKAKLLAIAGLMMAANTAIAAPATSVVNTTGLAVTDNSVKVGILHSSTGTMAISETGSIQAEKLAIEQINAAGGVLGRKIEYVQEDGASDDSESTEIIVSARRRDERLIDVPVAVTAISGESLEAAGAIDITDVQS